MSRWDKRITMLSNSQTFIPRCVLSNANVSLCPGCIVGHSRLALHCSSYSSVVYDANQLRCVCHCMASESRMNFLQMFRSCVPPLNSLLITVCEPEGAVVRVGPQPAGNFLDSHSLNCCRHVGSLLDHSHPVKRLTLWSKYNSQHSAHKNLGIRPRRFFLFCGLVAVETHNKGQPSTSGIIVLPPFLWAWHLSELEWLELNNIPLLAIEYEVHVQNSV